MAYSKIKLRRGTAYDWNSMNPVLEEGEIVVECPDSGVGTGLSKFKIGDGTTPYSSLPYAFDGMRANSIDGGGAEKFNIIQIRGAKAATWESVNPILNSRELGFDMTHISIKVGNGKNPWNELPFIKASDFTGLIIDCGDEENPEPDEDEIEYEEDYNHNDDPEPTPDPDNPDDPTPEPEPEPTPVEGDTLLVQYSGDEEPISCTIVNNVRIYTLYAGGTVDISMKDGVDVAEKTRIVITTGDNIRVNLNGITIDNSSLNDDTPAIITNSDNNTNFYVYGDNTIIGNGSYLVTPANGIIVSAGTGDLFFYNNGNLTVTDPMSSAVDYSEVGSSAGIYSRGAIGTYANITVNANGNGLYAAGNISDYQGTQNITSKFKNGIESLGDISYDASNITIKAVNGYGINTTGELTVEGYSNITITAPEGQGISAAGQNVSDFATITILEPEDESAEMEP